MWASVDVPTDSVPAIQSPKRKVGTAASPFHFEARGEWFVWCQTTQMWELNARWNSCQSAAGISWRHTVPTTIQKKDKWCDMAHSVVYMEAWVRWLLCNDIIPKAIPLSQRLTQCPHLAKHANTIKLIKLATMRWLWYVRDCPSRTRTGGWADIDNGWWNTPSHSLPHHPPIKTHHLSLSFHPHSTHPMLRP